MASTAPLRMASRVSCASCRRARSSSTSVWACGERIVLLLMSSLRKQIYDLHPYHDSLMRQITDHPAQGRGKHQRGRGHDVLAHGQHRRLIDVNNLQLVTILQVLVADFLDVADGVFGLLAGTGDKQAQHEASSGCCRSEEHTS